MTLFIFIIRDTDSSSEHCACERTLNILLFSHYRLNTLQQGHAIPACFFPSAAWTCNINRFCQQILRGLILYLPRAEQNLVSIARGREVFKRPKLSRCRENGCAAELTFVGTCQNKREAGCSCRTGEKETVAHLIVECGSYEMQRRELLPRVVAILDREKWVWRLEEDTRVFRAVLGLNGNKN